MESLNILCMSAAELGEFLQNEEIENPLVEYSLGECSGEQPVTYRETERFYNGGNCEDSGERELYEAESGPESVEELVSIQLVWERLDTCERTIVAFCIHSLEQSGYLPLSAEEIAAALETDTEKARYVLAQLKALEPCGIFASGLRECLLMQIAGMERESELAGDHTESSAGCGRRKNKQYFKGDGAFLNRSPQADSCDQGAEPAAA